MLFSKEWSSVVMLFNFCSSCLCVESLHQLTFSTGEKRKRDRERERERNKERESSLCRRGGRRTGSEMEGYGRQLGSGQITPVFYNSAPAPGVTAEDSTAPLFPTALTSTAACPLNPTEAVTRPTLSVCVRVCVCVCVSVCQTNLPPSPRQPF